MAPLSIEDKLESRYLVKLQEEDSGAQMVPRCLDWHQALELEPKCFDRHQEEDFEAKEPRCFYLHQASELEPRCFDQHQEEDFELGLETRFFYQNQALV